MRNGTRSNHRLTLIDNNGDEIGNKSPLDDIAVAADVPLETHEPEPPGPIDDLLHNKAVFAAVSIACLTAAVAAGSYALWLSRRKADQAALTNVHDLLKTCQSRMSQMEKDLKRLPRTSSSSA